jgi:hypothetical protein
MIGLFYFVLFFACATLVKFSARGLVDYFGPWPFIPLIVGVIVYGFWYERRARRRATALDLDCSSDS